jgi:PAS domain S-box-containing protein
MAKPSDKSGKKSGAHKGLAAGHRGSDEILPVRQLSILIVDDDPVDRMTVLRALKGTKLDPKITEATDIASAIDLIKKNGFDVVLLDHILPDGKSIDLLRKLRDAGIRLPVVVTTGYGDEMLVADLLKTGAADYLPKDRISADSVARAISHAIRIHKIEEEKLKKDTLLEAGAEAVILLNTQTERISVVSGALGILGKALGVDRLTAFEQALHATAKLPSISHRFEWSRDSEDFKFNDPGLQNMTYLSLGLARWHAVISSGHSIGGAIRSLPPEEQHFFTGRGVISILAVPVLVDGRCWGFVLIEDQRAERSWTEREKSMLTSVATSIGSTLMHRRADDALRLNEERFRAIVEAQTDYICRFLPNGIVTFVNEACCRYSGKKREELIGRPFASYVVEEDRQALLDQLSALSLQNPVAVSENRSIGPDGTIRWGQWTNRAIFNEQGQLVEIQGVGRDITERKKIEQELRESKEYLNTIINILGDPIFVKDEEHRFVLVNDAHTVLAGRTREQIIGKTDNDFFPKDQVDIFWAFDHKVLETGEENVNEECITDAAGRTRTIITKKTRYTDPFGKRFIVGVIRDITERKKAEDELRLSDARWKAHYKGYPVPTFTWRKDGEDFILVDFNNAAIDMTRDGVSNFQGQTAKVLHKDFPEGIAHLWRCYNGKSTFSEEIDYPMQTTGETRRLNSTYVFVPPDQVMVHAEDITERRRAEHELRTSEEQLRAQYKGFPIPTFTWTFLEDEFVLTDFNDAGVALTESNIKKHKGSKVTEFHKGRPDVIADIRRCMNDKLAFCREYDLRFLTTGNVRRVNVTYVYVPPKQVMVHVDDVTERRLAETALRDSEERYRTLAEASPDMIFMCAPNSDIIYANSLGARQWNLRPEQVAGKKQEELFPPELAERHKMAIRQVCETKKPLFSEVTEMLQQSKVWIETRLVPITNAAGEVTAVLGVSRNVTERRKMEEAVRESEANFRALAENAMDGIIIVTGENAQFVYANKAAMDMSGYPSDEILQHSLWDILMPEMHKEARATFQRRMAGDPTVPKRYETFAVRRDGQRIPVDVSIARTVWRGNPALLAIARDVSLQKKLEEERARLAASLLDIQENERQEISSMLHDHLGQLLTLTRLELGSVGSYDVGSKKSISNAIARLDEALGSVRRLAVSLRPPILDDLGIEVALETLTEEFADGSSIQTSFTHTGPKPALGNAEETCLYRVLQEALTNAAKHSEATRIDVRLRATAGEVCLEIHDNGEGFDVEAKTHDRGIGFIGMRERLSRCGGSLQISSEKGKGTTILAQIPRTVSPRQEGTK